MPRACWLALFAMAGLAACSTPRRVAGPEPFVAAAPDRIDGQYRGIARLTRAEGRGCPRSGARTVTVAGSAISVLYRGATTSYSLVGIVGADGSIHGSDGRGAVDGHISGRHMDLTVSSEYCEVRYALEHM